MTKKLQCCLILMLIGLFSCVQKQQNEKPDWKLGVALWTFHTVSFPDQLLKADSSGVEYVEGFAFAKAGPDLNDSMIAKLSPTGVENVMSHLKQSGLKMESLYIVGGKTAGDWVNEFRMAKQLGLRYVTAEPPINLWNSVDSLAGIYGVKVALHNHWKGVSAYWHPDSVLAAIKGHPNFGACPDVGHWPKSGLDAVEGLKKLEGHIIALHLKDIAAANDPSLRDVRVGTGIVDFPGIFAELKRQKFSGYIMIERDAETLPSNVSSVIETVAYYNVEVAKLK